ncbi:uncharacterized protein L201_006707 [Kwoniella dendrophila CBS 6074]|uniref:Uncharacterized protein n=1 Tax=Kwoniella dendrophila CBS 6074 TaxID=1295534 RepID=A0AAX4K4T2_9TREE
MSTTPILPKLVITPSTPLPGSTSYFDEPSHPPYPLNPSSMDTHLIQQQREKRRSRSSSFSSSSTSPSSSSSSSTISEKRHSYSMSRSYSLPQESYLNLPTKQSLTRSNNNNMKKPLKSPLISIIFLLFAFLVVLSTAMCTSSSAGKLLDIQRETTQKFSKILNLNVNGGCNKKILASTSKPDFMLDLDSEIEEPHHQHQQKIELNDLEKEDEGSLPFAKGILDYFWNKDSWNDYHHNHPSVISAGHAISLDGNAIWDFDS